MGGQGAQIPFHPGPRPLPLCDSWRDGLGGGGLGDPGFQEEAVFRVWSPIGWRGLAHAGPPQVLWKPCVRGKGETRLVRVLLVVVAVVPGQHKEGTETTWVSRRQVRHTTDPQLHLISTLASVADFHDSCPCGAGGHSRKTQPPLQPGRPRSGSVPWPPAVESPGWVGFGVGLGTVGPHGAEAPLPLSPILLFHGPRTHHHNPHHATHPHAHPTYR